MRIPTNVINFAVGEESLGVYKLFYDYWKHYQDHSKIKPNNDYFKTDADGVMINFSQKEEKMNAALRKEVVRLSGMSGVGELTPAQMATHPLLGWATYAVISNMIDMILPDALVDSIGMYTETRTIGWGDSANFTIKNRDLFSVCKSGKGKRTSEVYNSYSGDKTLVPEMHEISVGVSLYKVLAGLESLAELTAKVVRSIEVAITVDAYSAFETAMLALPATSTTGLYVTGYTQDYLTRLCEQVSAWNSATAAVVGTKRALASVLPTDANYRYMLEDEYMKIGYVQNAFGYPVLALPQVAKWGTPFDTLLTNSYIFIMSPGGDKFVKLVLEGTTLSNTTGAFQNADLSQSATFWKSWITGVVTSAVAGCIALS
jgi:hypothetical protein